MTRPLTALLDEMQSVVTSSSVPLGVPEQRHNDLLLRDAKLYLTRSVAALRAVLTFATEERDKIRSTYATQPGTAYAGYADAMDDVICTIEDVLRGES